MKYNKMKILAWIIFVQDFFQYHFALINVAMT